MSLIERMDLYLKLFVKSAMVSYLFCSLLRRNLYLEAELDMTIIWTKLRQILPVHQFME